MGQGDYGKGGKKRDGKNDTKKKNFQPERGK